MTQWVYNFGGGSAEGNTSMKNLLGGKGANLAEMASLGLPVPPGFTLTTDVCTYYYDNGEQYPDDMNDQIEKGLSHIEELTGKKFGDPANPLLVSVRSGARASMPGMMDTVLNLGLNDETVEGLAKLSGDRRFALDSYRRFITMYSDVVMGVHHHTYEDILERHKDDQGYMLDTEMTADDWDVVIKDFKSATKRALGRDFPQDPMEQLQGAVDAVFGSWMNERAIVYRRLNDIPAAWGTAVNVQAMVFGNMGDTSATGVAFTRDPSTGDNRYYGEFLINAQGEDVVAGIRTPQTLTKVAREEMGDDAPSMEEALPEVYTQLAETFVTLEAHYRDMQDIEFTVEEGKLWMLQTRTGKRTARAALKIAVDMAEAGQISQEEALLRVDPMSLDQLLHPTLNPDAPRDLVAMGLPASPGAAIGEVVFTSDEAETLSKAGHKVILVRVETSPEDIHGMHAAEAIVTARGGMTSHAAVVARGMGTPCVSGAGDIRIDYDAQQFSVAGRTIKKGEIVTVDGATGQVFFGAVEMQQPELSGDFAKVMKWADAARRLGIRTNAETPLDVQTAKDFGAEGIGLCRTEHMFFEADRLGYFREMILAEDKEGREAALSKILPVQREDFAAIFRIMGDLPCTIRLLDPPLHEFLPHTEADIETVAQSIGVPAKELMARATDLAESNPMLGHRGCRLGISYPEIYEMQARAIFEAQKAVAEETGVTPVAEIMVPLVSSAKELEILKGKIDAIAKDVGALDYIVGTMIELPRAALRAGDIAEHAEFFSFGTNDLTQTTFGLSRDDAGRFLPDYVSQGIMEKDPFMTLDQDGVGDLIQIATERGRKTKESLKLGICGEHGGDPASVEFCHRVGLNYVSCSPYRVPIARLAAAQAAIKETK
ncbi:pyruvate phosphate dikinase [Litorimonas taeanensis]|uniref:Pyruvate, phosphate dikinase n=1 Tax=Litorimonas taeanensis TaxID=568099 RepID=A0A420WJ97_9PROT|nr:pyruvate, phosphate dikinase [Litorimonas taeanensis]RKQ71002.1 pyruvate phosphate dikinase [Litorimonas taeanensis]